jgi:hypothetical protein
MDTRAGAATEAEEAGVDERFIEEAMTHTDVRRPSATSAVDRRRLQPSPRRGIEVDQIAENNVRTAKRKTVYSRI